MINTFNIPNWDIIVENYDKVVAKMKKNWPEDYQTAASVFVVDTKKTKLETSDFLGCHSHLIRGFEYRDRIIAIGTKVSRRDHDYGYTKSGDYEAQLTNFLNYLVNRSGYRDVFIQKDINIIMRDSCLYAQTLVPGNLLAGAFICSRFGWEHSWVVYVFNKLIELGLNEHMAFLIAPIFRLWKQEGCDVFNLSNLHSYHSGIAPAYITPQEIRNFVNAIPVKKNKNEVYLVSPRYGTINGVFCEGHDKYGLDCNGHLTPSDPEALYNLIEAKLKAYEIKEVDDKAKASPFTKFQKLSRTSQVHAKRIFDKQNLELIVRAGNEIYKEVMV